MERRTFLAASAVLLHRARVAYGQQQGRVYRIGYVNPGPPPPAQSRTWEAFVQGFRDSGLVQGTNLVIERRYASGNFSLVPTFLEEFASHGTDVIITVTTSVALEAKRLVRSTPVVMAVSTDPVGAGVVDSLSRPGANITGFALTGPELTGKRLELLRALAPRARKLVLMTPSDHPVYALYRRHAEAAQVFTDIRVENIGVAREQWEARFARIAGAESSNVAVLLTESPSLLRERAKLAELAAKYRLATIYGVREHVEAGGLMSYGTDLAALFRRSGSVVARIINGTKPSDIPVEQPTKFELVVNARAARALGLTIPQSLLVRADEVFE